MFFENNIHAFLKKGNFIHQKGNIKLLLNFLPTFIVNLHSLPWQFDTKYLPKQLIDQVYHKEEEIKRFRLQWFLSAIIKQFIPHLDLKRRLSIKLHEKEES